MVIDDALKNSIKGIYSASVTPMTEAGKVNFDAMRQTIRLNLKQGVEGFYTCGSTGEGLLLTVEERKKLLETVLDEAGGKVPVISHTGTIRTEDAIELTRHAKEAGASAVSMIPPYYYKFSLNEICSYYEDVMSSVDMPMMLYNIPAFTGISFNNTTGGRLLKNPQIIGIKHTSMNLYDLERMKSAYPEKVYFNGHDEIFLSALSSGAECTVGTTVNLFAKTFVEIRRLFLEGEMEAASRAQSRINEAIELFLEVGIFNAVKYAYRSFGIDCGSCRKPFVPLNKDQKARIDSFMKQEI